MTTPPRRKHRNTALSFGAGVGGGALLARRRRRFSLGKIQDTATASARSKIGSYSERLGAALAARVNARRPPVPLPKTRLGRAAHYLKKSRFGRAAIRHGVNFTSGVGARILRTRAARRFMADLV